MKFILPSLTLFLAAFAAAQSTGNIPQCALLCFAQATAQSGCDTSDLACQCGKGKATIQSSVTSCIAKTNPCSSSDIAKIQPAADQLCAKAVSSSSSGSATAGSSSGSATKTSASTSGSASSTSGASAAASSTGAASQKVIVGGLGALAQVGVAVGMFAL
ncbi:hypothetical protein NA57DRAFT_76715 [Rhizodiscina lignyota]|uniref:CFEM domain-containing protein n=1 Tax=Rhizodiscina lignyota TaxID=1504668 RepID=A0A9P4M5J6_9PEZI|nr:hypothetical protein NA57DRAFT_76715 [Rhizodiscina lignyota]